MEQFWENGDPEALKRFATKLRSSRAGENARAATGRRYYRNENDILRRPGMEAALQQLRRSENPLRNADYRIAHNWHQLLVNQKVAYLFSYPPVFDSGNAAVNEKIAQALGDDFPRVVKNLALDAANTGRAWLHVWSDADGSFRYAPLPSEEIYPLPAAGADGKSQRLLRIYDTVDAEERPITKYELWDAERARFFIGRGKSRLEPDCRFGDSNELRHGFGALPFVPFDNNSERSSDLYMIKDLIDQYDLVMSGFANDLTDIQEVIFVLRNYGGEDLNTFLSELKRYKAIKVEGDATGAGGVETMNIEIPIEARVRFLELLKRQIFISGQGVDPDPANFGHSSGVALKYLYSLLEIKAGLLETEFRAGFRALLRLLLPHLGLDPALPVTQLFTRNAIENELEAAEIAQKRAGLISRHTLVSHHPWVEEPMLELRLLARENAAAE